MAKQDNIFMAVNKKHDIAVDAIMNAGKQNESEEEISADIDEIHSSQEIKVGASEVVIQKEGQETNDDLDNLAIVFKSKAKVKKVPINLSIRPTTKTKLQKMCKKTKMTNSDFVEQLIIQIYDRMMGE